MSLVWTYLLMIIKMQDVILFKEVHSMGYGVKFKVWGDYACFTRPEMKVERVSYDVITPSAARGIFQAVFWKPAIRWIIKEI